MGSCLHRLPGDPQRRTAPMSPLQCFAINNPFTSWITRCRSLPRPPLPPSTAQQRRRPSLPSQSQRGHRSLAAPSQYGRVQVSLRVGFAFVGSSSAPQQAPGITLALSILPLALVKPLPWPWGSSQHRQHLDGGSCSGSACAAVEATEKEVFICRLADQIERAVKFPFAYFFLQLGEGPAQGEHPRHRQTQRTRRPMLTRAASCHSARPKDSLLPGHG